MVTGTNKQEFIDSLFKSEETNHYHLSIETGDSFLCCAVHDAKSGKLLAVETEKPNYMDQSFQSVSCAIVNSFFTLIPNDIFESSESENYLALNTNIPQHVNFHFNLIPALNAYCVFAVERDFELKLEKKYPSVILKHALAIHIEQMISRSEKEKTCIWVNVFKNNFELIIIQNGKLKFSNIFEYKIHEDLAYYMHFALEQLNIEISDSTLFLIGPYSNSVMSDYLKKFFHLGLPENNKSSEDYSNRFYTLIHQQACV